MSHAICVVVAAPDLIFRLADGLPVPEPVPAANGLLLLPIQPAFLAACGAPAPALPGPFKRLSEGLHARLCATSSQGPLGYLETEYFGGLGRQSAALFEDGALRLGPLSHDTTHGTTRGPATPLRMLPINQVLRRLGVTPHGSADEFDTAGLGAVRSNDDWTRVLATG